MKVFLLKDVEKVGMANEIIKVTPGYAQNYLFPRKLALLVTPENEASFVGRRKVIEHRQEVIATKTSMQAEKIKATVLELKVDPRKVHKEGDSAEKLYGAVNAGEIVDLLAEKGISVAKNQIEFDKSIKTIGKHEVTIKLSSRLKPKLTLVVVLEKELKQSAR